MNEFFNLVNSLTPSLALCFAEGVLLGLFFFVGLWWTVRKLDSTNQVALLFLCSMLIRSSIVVLGFYFILGEDWRQLVAGLFGFFIARIIVTRLIRIAHPLISLLQVSGHES